MPTGDAIVELFQRLEQTASLRDALLDGLRIAAERTQCAAALAKEPDGRTPRGAMLYRDPLGLFDSSGDRRIAAAPPASRGRLELRIALKCVGRPVGELILRSTQELNAQRIKLQLAQLPTVLALLAAADQSGNDGSVSNVLTREAFRARVAHELSQSKRASDHFAVIHIRLDVALSAGGGDDTDEAWAAGRAAAETLTERLRHGDIVGLIGPGRVAALLPATGRLASRIAGRRIETILSPDPDADGSRGAGGGTPECDVRSFPDDGGDIEALFDDCYAGGGIRDAQASLAGKP